MKSTKLFFTICLPLLMLFSACSQQKSLKVLVITGGHAYDTTDFVDLFLSLDNIDFDTVIQPHANRMIATGGAMEYDVLVFYDMWEEITQDQKAGYLSLLDSGKGMVFLHHALVSYQQWDEFESIVGGKFYSWKKEYNHEKPSGFKHDILIDVEVLDKHHPVTHNVKDFKIHDEGYTNISVLEDVTLLLENDHLACHPYTGWTHVYDQSKIVYLLHGHDRKAYENKSFRKILQNAIAFVAD